MPRVVWLECCLWHGVAYAQHRLWHGPNAAHGMAPALPILCPQGLLMAQRGTARCCPWHIPALPMAQRATAQPCPWHSAVLPVAQRGTSQRCPVSCQPLGAMPRRVGLGLQTPPPPQGVSRVGTSPVKGRGTLPGPPPSDSRHSSWAPPLPADVEAVPETCQRWGGSQGHRLRLPPVLGGG